MERTIRNLPEMANRTLEKVTNIDWLDRISIFMRLVQLDSWLNFEACKMIWPTRSKQSCRAFNLWLFDVCY
jgi:hypothetical protein